MQHDDFYKDQTDRQTFWELLFLDYKIDEKVKKEEKKIFENFFAKIVRVPPVKILTKKKVSESLGKGRSGSQLDELYRLVQKF